GGGDQIISWRCVMYSFYERHLDDAGAPEELAHPERRCRWRDTRMRALDGISVVEAVRQLHRTIGCVREPNAVFGIQRATPRTLWSRRRECLRDNQDRCQRSSTHSSARKTGNERSIRC